MTFSIYDFYDMVLSRPELFIGEHGITKLETYLSAADMALTYQRFYQQAEQQMPLNEANAFDEWLNQRTNTESFHEACMHLKRLFNSDEKALVELIKLYKEFRGDDFGALFAAPSHTGAQTGSQTGAQTGFEAEVQPTEQPGS